MKVIALVPARAGSKRVPDKNIADFNGEPLLVRAVKQALTSGIFDQVVVSSDSERYLQVIRDCGLGDVVLQRRPESLAQDDSSDIDWVQDAIERLNCIDRDEECAFAILRPTSPFRTTNSIVECWETFKAVGPGAHSIRAVTKADKHPAKMWTIGHKAMKPILPFSNSNGVPWHSCQSNTLPEVYSQTASIEFFWRSTIENFKSIAGEFVMPFVLDGLQCMDINTQEDLIIARTILKIDQPK